ncbi:hypothetical protein LCL95_00435 [Bacillus timonensis]|nr:hypothetical protein [Bacillus timonensis]
MAKDELTPSKEVDQKALLNEKVNKARQNDFKGDHVRQTSPTGVPKQ